MPKRPLYDFGDPNTKMRPYALVRSRIAQQYWIDNVLYKRAYLYGKPVSHRSTAGRQWMNATRRVLLSEIALGNDLP